jgi:glycosyltransferase involved in cell wall biosynthesis
LNGEIVFSPKIVHVSTLPPTQCGIATYTSALSTHLTQYAKTGQMFIRLATGTPDILKRGRDGGHLTISPECPAHFRLVRDLLDGHKNCVVFLQHEFKLYGAPDGTNVLPLLDCLNAPVVTTLHTVWPEFPPARNRVFAEVLRRSDLVFVLSDRSAEILRTCHGLRPEKIRVVPHGIPDVPFRLPTDITATGGACLHPRFVSVGLMRPAKGIELALAAFRQMMLEGQDFTYVVCGLDHPKNEASYAYRRQLMTVVEEMDLSRHVQFIERFLPESELVDVIQSCDVGLLPYTVKNQSSSGVLALILGCGRPVIASDFQHALSVIQADFGAVFPLGDVDALIRVVREWISRAESLGPMMARAYASTRTWCWSEVAQAYFDGAQEIVGSKN